MTKRATRHCRWTPLAASLVAACIHGILVAAPAPSAPGLSPASLDLVADEDPPPDATGYYLEVTLNEAPTGRLARFLLIDERLHASASTLRELGLRWPGSDTASGLLALDSIPGLQVRYEASEQLVRLTAPLDFLSPERTRFGPETRAQPRLDPATRAPGLLLNYDLYAQGDSDYQSYSGWNEIRLFGLGPGTWTNTMVGRMSHSRGAGDSHGMVRLDSTWQLDFPDTMLSVVAGDTVTGSLAWTRPTRIGGVRVGSNFSLQPYRVTTPLASFAGDAVLPSTVDLFIDGIRQSSQQVQPGRFQVDATPVITGAGQARMVITDINGQSRVVNFPLYSSSQLLQDGLTDWSVEAGLVRRHYGLRSASYADDLMASYTVRRGLSGRLTLEGHAQATRGLQMAGAGTVMLLGEHGGILDVSLALSRGANDSGHQYGAGYQWNSRLVSINLGTQRRNSGFADVATLEGSELPRRIDRAFAGLSLPMGHVGTSYVRQDFDGGIPRSRFASLSWARALPFNNYLSASLNHDLDDNRGDTFQIYWSLPLDRSTTVAASTSRSGGRNRFGAEANRTVNSDVGGWGWRAQASAGVDRTVQAEVTRLHDHGQWDTGLHHSTDGGAGSSTSGFASASGSVLLMARHLFAMRRVYDSFALVSTDGIPGVPILLENRLVGRTDEDGLLLVTRLNAWQNNRLEIDALKAPPDVRLGRTEMQAVPWGGSGILARFPMKYSVSVHATVTDANGMPLPAGSPVWVAEAAPGDAPLTVIGFDGALFLQDPPGTRLRIRHAGGVCETSLPPPGQSRGHVELDGVVCR